MINILYESKKTYFDINKIINCRYPIGKNKKINNLNEICKDINEDIHNDKKKYYDFRFRYGQELAFNIFKDKIKAHSYWGLMVAPTGWGKSMMHYIFIEHYLTQQTNKNVLLLSKRIDIMEGILNEINDKRRELRRYRNFNFSDNRNVSIYDRVSKLVDEKAFSEYKNSIVIANIDNILNKNINWKNYGLIIFDESHWAGADKTTEYITEVKKKVPYCIGSSATPIRRSETNQDNIYELFKTDDDSKKYEIMYNVSYKDAWENKVILKIDNILFDVEIQNSIDKKSQKQLTSESKKTIITEIYKVLEKSYKRKIIMFCLEIKDILDWYDYIKNNDYFTTLNIYTSFSKPTENEEKLDIIDKYDIKHGTEQIIQFKNQQENALLLVAGRATEGFNDPLVDICIDVSLTYTINILSLLQKMGRAQRTHINKTKGYYLRPIMSNTSQQYKQTVVEYIHNYIKYTIDNKYKYTRYIWSNSKEDSKQYIKELFKIKSIDGFTTDDIIEQLKQYEIKQIKTDNTKKYKQKVKDELIRLEINDKYDYEEKYIQSPYLCHINDEEQLKMVDVKKLFGQNWYEILNPDTNNFIEQLNVWINECKSKNITTGEKYINEISKLKKKESSLLNDTFPSMPDEFYKEFTNYPDMLRGLSQISRR